MTSSRSRLANLQDFGIYPTPVASNLWDNIAGMQLEKDLIEKKILLPLMHHELAKKHGVVLPKGILLFGPPGTGKTTFSKGIAGRLGWTFVEVPPGELAHQGMEHQARRLREFFQLLQWLERAVIFFDEFEELALHPERASPTERMVSNEMLRQLPKFRQGDQRLLICATNNIRMLNPAMLRVGRFDFVLPMGPLNNEARKAVFQGYLGRLNVGEVDMDVVTERARYFTPADIEAVCALVAQDAFEREIGSGQDYKVQTADVLRAIEAHPATLRAEDLERFKEDIARYCRADYCRLVLE